MSSTVLIVDDEPLIRMDAASLLEEAGFDVNEAGSADEAIDILNSTPDIWAVFTDVDMPGSMDGICLAHAVRDRWPPVHIFVMSGHRVVEEADLPVGGRFFSKPYDSVVVVAAFRELHSNSSSA
jgi:two-component system, response regulator PdtaR